MIQETVSYTNHNFRIQTKMASNYSMTSHHFHHEYEIYYMNSGSRLYFIHDRTYRIKEGDLVLIRPHELHKTIDTGNPHSRLLMSFKADYIKGSQAQHLLDACFSQSSVYTFDYANRQHIEFMLNELLTAAKEDSNFKNMKIKAFFTIFLIKLAEYIHVNMHNTEDIAEDEKTSEIISYLKDHYRDKLSLDQLAETFFISRYYMTRLFKKNTGFTIFEYIQSLRIIEAQHLLTTTMMKVSDISNSVGFANSTSLGKVFKSVTGVSPLAYRKLNAKK